MFELFRKGTKKNVYLDKLKDLDPFNGDNRGEIKAIVVVILAIVIGAILTGAIGPTSLGLIVNATQAGGALGGASVPSAVTQTWNTIPVMYAIGFFIIPIAAVIKYMDM